jgi:hypothetical protein
MDILDCQSGIKNVVNYLTWIEIGFYINTLIQKEKDIITEHHNNKLVYNYTYRSFTSAEKNL